MAGREQRWTIVRFFSVSGSSPTRSTSCISGRKRNTASARTKWPGRAGHTVAVSSTDPQQAQAAAQATGARAARSNREAIDGAQIVILAVPYNAVEGIIAEAGGALDGKIVVDVTNRLNVDNPAAAI